MEFDIINNIIANTVGQLFSLDVVYGGKGKSPFKAFTPKV